jgi:hypothetical protein
VRLKFVFFKARCADICDTESANFSSIAFSVKSLTAQRRYPSGTFDQASAINPASKAPPNFISLSGFSRFFRVSVASSPFHTNRFLRCSTDRTLTARAEATSTTFQACPSGPALQRSRAHVLMNRLASILPRQVIDSSSSRSPLVSVSRYLLAEDSSLISSLNKVDFSESFIRG